MVDLADGDWEGRANELFLRRRRASLTTVLVRHPPTEVGSCGERDIVVNWDVVGGVPFAHFANAVPG